MSPWTLVLVCACSPVGGVLFGSETGEAGTDTTTTDATTTDPSTSSSSGASATSGSGTSTSTATSAVTATDSGGSTTEVSTGSSGSGGTTGASSGYDVGIIGSCTELEAAQVACDVGSTDVGEVLGIGCSQAFGLVGPPTVNAHVMATAVRESLGEGNPWMPTEGSRFLVLGTGPTTNLDTPPTPFGGTGGTGGNRDLGGSTGGGGGTTGFGNMTEPCSESLPGFDVPGGMLPAPMTLFESADDCLANPGAVNTGDCSRSLAPVLPPADCMTLGPGCVNDYTEIRISLVPPEHAVGLAFDVAFLTAEYPEYVGTIHDMFIAWLETSWWTGNVTYDLAPAALSPESDLLQYFGDAPELTGTCMETHAATPWLTTTFPVTPGDPVNLVFAVVDNSDTSFDSFALLDGLRWTCAAGVAPDTVIK